MKANSKYLSYVLRHKWFVFLAGLRTGAPLWRLLIHDWSKFLPSEWFPYVRHFYGDREYYNWVDDHGKYLPGFTGRGWKQVLMEFDRAWLHHQHSNPHHWQHWILREDSGTLKILDMPDKFIREMVADWMGAGRAITGKWEALEWYEKNKGIIQLSRDSRIAAETYLHNATIAIRGIKLPACA